MYGKSFHVRKHPDPDSFLIHHHHLKNMELDDVDADGPPLLVEASKQEDNEVDERLVADVYDINLVKVPITIVTGRVIQLRAGDVF